MAEHQFPSDIPTFREWLDQPVQKTRLDDDMKKIEWHLAKFGDRPDLRLKMAVIKDDYATADAIMKEQGWTGISCYMPDSDDWEKDASLIFISCYGNGFAKVAGYKLFLYLADRDPAAAVLATTPETAGTMLHANMTELRPEQVVELLKLGVNPYRRDNRGMTYLDCIEKIIGMNKEWDCEPSAECLKVKAIVEDFMKHHTQEQCEAREEAIKANSQRISWASRQAVGLDRHAYQRI